MLNTKRNEIFNGNDVVNSHDLRRRVINIDSRFRTILMNPTTDFTFSFANTYKNVIRARVASIEIPNVFYNFSTTLSNTYFKIFTKDYNGIKRGAVITIPDGKYNVCELIKAVNLSLYNQLFVPFGIYITIQNFPIQFNSFITYFGSFNKSGGGGGGGSWPPAASSLSPEVFAATLKAGGLYLGYPIKAAVPFDLDFCIEKFQNRIYDFGLGYNLGFRGKKYHVDSSGGEYGSIGITSESCIDVYGTPYYFLAVDDFSSVEQKTNENNFQCLAKIIVREQKGEIIYDDGCNLLSNEVTFPSPIDIRQVRVRLLDSYGNLINLNDMNFSFSLEVTEVMNTKLYEFYRNYIWLGADPAVPPGVRGSAQGLLGGRGP